MLLLVADLKMMVRDRQTFFWALAFPLIFVTVFGLVDFDGAGSASMAIIDRSGSGLAQGIADDLAALKFLKIETKYPDEQAALAALEDNDLGYVLIIPPEFGEADMQAPGRESVSLTLQYDDAEVSYNQLIIGTIQHLVDETNISLTPAPRLVNLEQQPIPVRQVDYFDRVLVGLIGMGLMVNSIIAVAVRISNYRNKSILKRVLATPLRIRNYFAAEVISHLVLAMVQTGVILAAGIWIFGADLRSEAWLIFPIAALANIVFINLGFIISGWANSGSAASGMGNAIALPVMFLSGTFFATSTLPSVLPDIVRYLPLTPMLDAMREVSLDGAALWDTWPELAILGGWIAVTSIAAVKLFRFG